MSFKVTIFVLFLIFSLNFAKFHLRVKKIECFGSNKTVVNYNCYTKAYNRRSPVFNIELVFKRKTENLKLSTTHHHRIDDKNSYRQILHIENIEICKIIKGSETSAFLKQTVDWMKSVLKDYDHLCKTLGQIKFLNSSVPDSEFLKWFPSGQYLSGFKYFDEIDSDVINLNFSFVMNK
ncbi:hypothetical protein PVAND_016483 [Polypedilum vanderplanki]|uniref:Uncharacterized protein n=1 Tax=Polypedilum vanderplanki TaxID=319348 RepID=A0A9J6BF73_POLVA|nr:hypothetical protein PVAND_016483 [Polypedilum vanderplanki]